MKVYRNTQETPPKARTIVLGNFDGVHQGHRQLIQLGRKLADEQQQELMVFTFYPQLQAIFRQDFKYLISQEKKLALFLQLQVDEVLAMAFNDVIARTSPEDFVCRILLQDLQAKNIVVGFNYTFGYGGLGTPEVMAHLSKDYGVSVTVMPPYYCDEQLVNSTMVREYVAAGQMLEANKFLGYAFSLQGEVIHGRKVGRTIGIPTANLCIASELLLPAKGVYAARVKVASEMKLGVLNIGSRPTVDNGVDTTVEVHILDFDGDIYGEYLEVMPYQRLRGETKFSGLDALKAQIQQDMVQTRALLA